MLTKRDFGSFLFGVLVGMSGVKFVTHAFYIAIIVGLSIGIYLK